MVIITAQMSGTFLYIVPPGRIYQVHQRPIASGTGLPGITRRSMPPELWDIQSRFSIYMMFRETLFPKPGQPRLMPRQMRICGLNDQKTSPRCYLPGFQIESGMTIRAK